MIQYRVFLNTDPPKIAEVWRSHPPLRGLIQAVTPTLLERYVWSKPYFDRHGLILAVENDQCIGFAHAGFGPAADFQSISREQGAISAIRVVPHPQRNEIGQQLLYRAEAYLRGHGTQQVVAGGVFPVNPFYLGFYGGSRLPGVLREDRWSLDLFLQHGYEETGTVQVLQCALHGFRPLVNRQQMANRRGHQVLASFDPMPENWWEACTLGWADRVRFTLQEKNSRQPCGQVMFWDMEPLASHWGVRGMGLYDLMIDEPKRCAGRATYLIGESLRQLASQNISMVEVQIPSNDPVLAHVFSRLGFQRVDEGIRLERRLNGPGA